MSWFRHSPKRNNSKKYSELKGLQAAPKQPVDKQSKNAEHSESPKKINSSAARS